MVQWGGWLMILHDLLLNTSWSNPTLSPYCTSLVYIFQLLAILEVVHAVIGLVRSSPVTTFIQVFGRLQVLFIHYKLSEAQNSAGNLFMVTAWSLVEIVRYLYLALNTAKVSIFPIMWLRYSLFYILYPIGVYGEMKVLYDSLPGIDRTELLSATLPNEWNLSFSFGRYVRLFLVAAYIPGLLNQYTYMMRQRRAMVEKLSHVKKD